ncbi:MAG: 7-carboxy-7-deazaguanine synthase QueE [Gemmatimonadetes bacterium]|jgi:organic radical activating enzyme|nr:7-carboxy-7-deazaguanine synthase QueE [Gemmatimonadota bacterium]
MLESTSSSPPENPAEKRTAYQPIWRDDGHRLQINEIFYSIEGEGLRVGQPTTFVRLSRCNLRCHFCDTEFDSFSEMDLEEIGAEVDRHPARWVCFTGGEPLGQNIAPLARLLKENGYQLHIETNGTLSPDPHLFGLIDHWTVSPKCYPIAGGFERITELKYVVGKSFREDRVQTELAELVYLQPESSEPRYVQKAMEILTRHPEWRLSCRIHKVLGLP